VGNYWLWGASGDYYCAPYQYACLSWQRGRKHITTSFTGQHHLERIISKALAKRPLSFNEILCLLSLKDTEAIRVMLAANLPPLLVC